MDIVVTIPKREYKNDDLETECLSKDENAIQWWSMSKTPKKVKIGDRVYFVKNNKVESSMKVIDIELGSNRYCEVTYRFWNKGCNIIMNDLRYENLDIEVKGFQGFRYRWWED